MEIRFADLYILAAVACWAAVAVGATIAVFSPLINDTVGERVTLSLIGLASVAQACRIWYYDFVTEGHLALAAALAAHVAVLILKHRRTPRRRAADRRKA